MVFNRQLALERVGGDEELLNEILELYLGEYPALLAEIRMAVEAGDAEALFRSAHRLKGSLGTLAAEAALDRALDLEMSGRTSDLARTPAMLSDLENLLRQLHSTLAKT